ncbi:MAG: hypothetical protein SVM80_12005 [Halobacteriota archaeon]|nr:hypothetical protein [Halobacteriota archaeon]
MNKKVFVIFAIAMLLLQPLAVSALTAGEAKQEWHDARQLSREARQAYRDARIEFVGNNTPENEQKVIDTGKDSLHAALDEAEAWLIWANLNAQENPEIPDELKQTIEDDVNTNLEKIEALRVKVDGIQRRIDIGLVFLEMVTEYIELVSDVARNTGMMWVHVADTRADTVEDYEAKLRAEAEGMDDNEDIIEKLDQARSALEDARENIDNANSSYNEVRIHGQPLIQFAEGNNYLRTARTNLLSAHSYLNQAFNLMVLRS